MLNLTLLFANPSPTLRPCIHVFCSEHACPKGKIPRFLCKDAVHLPVLIEDLDGSLISCTELELLPASMVQPRWFKFNKR
ncbi:hypothetical protein CK203_091092 [Vitis vinifera]|uniref:Uncharacterized protein n=1 Tax=Vitis vinifera TaxID=29760 RepID=A0A438FH99_VITVI|nr:hypothetical protein CK203_091092 [Vitis vinifera]